MDILTFAPEHDRFRLRLRDFLAREVTPHVDRWEADGIVPKQVWRHMGREGFLCMQVAPEFGGLGGDFRYAVIVADELTRTAHSGLCASLHSDVVVPYIDSFGSDRIRRRYLPGCVSGEIVTAIGMTEPGAGSDLAGMTTTAVDDGDQIIINGSKTFISNGINADLLVLAARDPGVADPYKALSLFVVEDGTPGFKRGRRLAKMGFHSQDTAELFFSDCRIPAANRLGEKGMGFYMLMEKLQQERLATAIAAVPAAERILEWTVDFCRAHPPAGKPLMKYQVVQFALVEMTTEVKLGRTFTEKLVADHVEGLQIVAETSMAKYWTTEMVKRVADRCLDLIGDHAYLETCPIARAWRDVRVMSIFAGTNEIMKVIAARFMGL
jgi:alkylation response protein AidB-like acyl-CoA dehydrogenase